MTLAVISGGTFRGFFVEARTSNNNAASLGKFDANNDVYMKTLDCFGQTSVCCCLFSIVRRSVQFKITALTKRLILKMNGKDNEDLVEVWEHLMSILNMCQRNYARTLTRFAETAWRRQTFIWRQIFLTAKLFKSLKHARVARTRSSAAFNPY